ncbi:zinc finger, CCHC-type containing protein, partial [Tanacetum coccineum]
KGLLVTDDDCKETESRVSRMDVDNELVDNVTVETVKESFAAKNRFVDKGVYLQIVASIEQYSDLSEMTLEEAIGRLKTYEERIKYKGKQVDNQDRLLFTRYEEQGRRRGHGGSNQSQGQESNFKKETHNNSNKLTHDKSKIMCFKCKEYGHYANRCPLKKEEQSNLIEEDLQPQLLMAIIEESRIWNGRKFHSTST